MNIYTKQGLIDDLRKIRKMGWIKNTRPGNQGGIGNTLEDLLGIDENNLPIPNAAEWEMKTQRIDKTNYNTLFHMEPSPRALKFVPCILLPKYGWPHKQAGKKYPNNEMSFRQTISCNRRSDRGFKVVLDRKNEKVLITFDANYVDKRHSYWLESVKTKVGLGEINPQPYWGFDDLFHKAGTKLLNCFFIMARVKIFNGEEYFHYEKIYMLQKLNREKFFDAIEHGTLFVDFDARTGHNHGTKFRMIENRLPDIYDTVHEL